MKIKIKIYVAKTKLTFLKATRISPLQELVQKMLHVDPSQRISLQQVLQQPWIAKRDQLPQLRLAHQDANLVKVSVTPHRLRSPGRQPRQGECRSSPTHLTRTPTSSR